MADQGITLDFTKAQPLQAPAPQPAQSQPSPSQSQYGDMQTPQRFPNATGAAEGPDGQMYWHDIQNKQLGPLNQDELAIVNQPQTQKPVQPKPAGVTLDFSKAQPLQAPAQQSVPEKPGTIHRLWDKVNKGLVSQNAISTALTGMTTEQLNSALKADPNIKGKTIHIPGFGDIDVTEFARGVFNSTAKVASDFTSPLSIGLMAAGPLTNAGRAGQAIRAAKVAQVAEDTVSAADAVYAARTGELVRATTQAEQAAKAAQTAREAELAGQASRDAVIAAENTASEAAANATKAQKALSAAQEARGLNAVEAAKANRAAHEAIQASLKAGSVGLLPEEVGTAARAVGKTAAVGFTASGLSSALIGTQPGETVADEFERRVGGLGWAALGAEGLRGTPADVNLSEVPDAIKEAPRTIGEAFKEWHDQRQAQNADEKLSAAKEKTHGDLMKAIPPTKAAPYSFEDMETARNYIEHQHNVVNEKMSTPAELRDGIEAQREGIEKAITDLVQQRYANEPIASNPKVDVFNALADQEKVTPGFRAKAMSALNKYNITDMTMSEADALRAQLNKENRATLKKNNWAIGDALATDPKFAARYNLAESLRNGVYNQLEAKQIKGIREMRQDESSLIRVRNAADRQEFNGEKTVRGTGEAGAFRKGAAKMSTLAGAATGAAAGAATGIPLGTEAGAVIGAGIGKKAGEYIAPPDLTRNQLIERSLENKVATGLPKRPQGAGAELTPKAGAPVEKQQILPENTRENSPLHSALATHYDETIGDTPYQELEKRFLDDVKIKKQHKVPLDGPEKTILKGINEAKAKEILDARREIEKQSKENEAKRAEEEKNPVRRAELAAEDLPKLGMSALRAVAERVPDFLDNFTVEKSPIEKGYIGTVNYKGKPFAYLGVPSETFEKVFGKVSDFAAKGQNEQAESTFNQLVRKSEERSNLEATLEPQVIGSNVAEANQPRLETEEEDSRMPYGFDRDKFHNHEWGHVAVAAAEGIPAKDFISTEHPGAISSRMVGGIGWSEHPYVSDPKAEEKYTPQEIWDNTKKWLSVYMGGAAANELLDGIEFEKNRGLMADKRNARNIMRAHGLDDTDAEVMMIDAFRRATEHLTKPGVLDTIKENAKLREENLPKTLHASPGRLENFQNHVKGLLNANTNTEANAGARQSGGETEENESKAARRNQARSVEGRSEASNAKKLIEDAGLVYKGELTKGSGVYMFEHPEFPGKTMALKEADITPEKLHQHVAEKLGLFEVVK